jgi:hypothetical protein
MNISKNKHYLPASSTHENVTVALGKPPIIWRCCSVSISFTTLSRLEQKLAASCNASFKSGLLPVGKAPSSLEIIYVFFPATRGPIVFVAQPDIDIKTIIASNKFFDILYFPFSDVLFYLHITTQIRRRLDEATNTGEMKMENETIEVKANTEAAGRTGFALLYTLFPFLKKEPEYAPDSIDYGHGYAGRKLIDGRYVLEKIGTKLAVDLKSPSLMWAPGTQFYQDCIADSAKELNSKAKRAMAGRGV